MPIPFAQSAIVDPAKIVDYLLNESHPIGGPKARWFVSLGFSSQRPSELSIELLRLVRESENIESQTTPFGVKYIVRGTIRSSAGNPGMVLSVWIHESQDTSPRLVTAYPDTSH